MTRRRLAAALLAAPAAAAAIAKDVQLIAHRGGVVDDQRPENSPGAVQAAIGQGYWMIEVDVRRSSDGEPVLYHDTTLAKYFAESRGVEQMSWPELRRLKSKPAGQPPLHFEQLCAMCAGKMRLMLDLKGQWEPAFYQRILRYIEAAKLPGPVYSLGGPRVRPLFEGRVMVSVNRKTLRTALDAREPVGERYFLFELGSDLDEPAIAEARKHNITTVAAINTFRYTMAKRDEWQGPQEDIARLRKMGVTTYQVDSRYEPLF